MASFQLFAGRSHRLVGDSFVAGGSSSTDAAPSQVIDVDVDMEEEDSAGNYLAEWEEEEKRRLDAMILVSTAWQQKVPDHRYTVPLHDAIADFQLQAVKMRSQVDEGMWVDLNIIIDAFGELRGQVKPFVSGQEQEEMDAFDDQKEAAKRRRIGKKAPDMTGAFEDPNAVDID